MSGGLSEALDCLENCYSFQHGRDICSISTGASGINAVPLFAKKCANYAQVNDEFGRTALHILASVGNVEALEYLVKRCGGNTDKRDKISGYTPLHRSIFFGQIHVARSLINFNADQHLKDNEGMTALDLCNADCPRAFEVNIKSDPTELFVWGSNDNYTLGSLLQQSRPTPEQLEMFKKNNTRIMQVAVSHYHTLFLSQFGEIFVCGAGRHGRLGLGHDKSELQPQLLHIRSSARCVSISAGVDHSFFLMENGRVLSCGSNEFGISGQKENVLNSLVPKTVEFPGKINIEGIIATRYHSVFYTSHEIFTCGLNRGQLGHAQEKGTSIFEPKIVSQIAWTHDGDTKFTHFAASTCATVARANTGILYVLHKFDCYKINAKQFDVVKLQVTGGSFADNHHGEKLGHLPNIADEHLVILILTSTGRIVVWRSQINMQATGTGIFSRAIFNCGRVLDIADISLCPSSLLLVTRTGEAYKSLWRPLADPCCILNWQNRHQNSGQHGLNDFQVSTGSRRSQKGKDNSSSVAYLEYLKLQKIKNIYSALTITSDDQGKNFAVIQSSPKTELTSIPVISPTQMNTDMLKFLEEGNEEDTLHDIILKVENRRFPAHSFIIASECKKLLSYIESKKPAQNNIECPKTIEIDNVSEKVFEQILKYIYTGTCDLLQFGKKIFNFHGQDIIKLTTESARRWELERLCKELRKLTIVEDEIKFKSLEFRLVTSQRRFIRQSQEHLSDIILQSLDGQLFKAHRCILVARSEYFYSMLFANVWLEQSGSKPVQMQFSGQCLQVFLDYIYEDCISNLTSTDFDALSEILAMSDNLFMDRLRTLVESALADILSLKNVASMLYLADRCNAAQLKETCMQLISMNLPLVLETRLLDALPLEIVKDLSGYYREFHPKISTRKIKRALSSPSDIDFEEGMKNMSTDLKDDIEASYNDEEIRKPLVKTVKNKVRIRSVRLSESESHEPTLNISLTEENAFHGPPTPPSLPSTSNTVVPKISKTTPSAEKLKARSIFPNPSQTMAQLKAAEAEEEKRKLNPKEFPSLCGSGEGSNFAKYQGWQKNIKPQSSFSPSPKDTCNSGDDNTKQVEDSSASESKLAQTPKAKVAPGGHGKRKTKWKSVDLNNVANDSSPKVKIQPTIASPPTRDPANPWKIENNSKKQAFSDIVQDEVEKKANFERAVTKSLSLMQIEDRAINELTARYHSSDVEEGIELLTVERICSTNFAPPTWVQHSPFNMNKQSSSPKTKR